MLTAQFILSLGFIMAVVIMMRQYQYSLAIQNEFGKLSSVNRISLSSHILGIGSAPEQYIKTSSQSDSIQASSISIDEAFLSNMKLGLLAGRDFSRNTDLVCYLNFYT